ncbi:KEOPS complex subunit TP53RK isoform X1 [Octopus vulgaris]|uniref:KEOPS complex subunit TP53RK isoform X1 n=1 Tax=Octopus vulgaris TaxID=6645 RepID=A0AA36BRZ3_OCTVU|nr:KEOPS complex subunit TP53RK isoform X1 [Octopus vulgaris]
MTEQREVKSLMEEYKRYDVGETRYAVIEKKNIGEFMGRCEKENWEVKDIRMSDEFVENMNEYFGVRMDMEFIHIGKEHSSDYEKQRTDDRMMALSKEERIPDRMMNLSKEERIELVLLSGREGWSYRKIAEEFNLPHPCRQPIYFTAVRKLIKKFKETGSVSDKPRSGRPKTSDETKEAVEAKVSAS